MFSWLNMLKYFEYYDKTTVIFWSPFTLTFLDSYGCPTKGMFLNNEGTLRCPGTCSSSTTCSLIASDIPRIRLFLYVRLLPFLKPFCNV